jgi:hypothetical protein
MFSKGFERNSGGWDLKIDDQKARKVYAFAVDELFAVIGLEQQPVASGHFQLTGFAHVEGRGGAGRDEIHFCSIRAAHAQAVFDRGHDLHRIVTVKLFGLANEAQSLARFVLADIPFLRCRPRKRIKDGDSFIPLADNALDFQRLTHFFRDSLDLRPGGRNERRRFALADSGQISLSSLVVKIGVWTVGQCFRDRAKFEQLGKRLFGVFGGGQFDNLAECFRILVASNLFQRRPRPFSAGDLWDG